MMDPSEINYLRQAYSALAKAVGKVNEAIILMESAEVGTGERTLREPLSRVLLPQVAKCERDLVHMCRSIQRYIEADRDSPT